MSKTKHRTRIRCLVLSVIDAYAQRNSILVNLSLGGRREVLTSNSSFYIVLKKLKKLQTKILWIFFF